jgi:hypothetical protein
MTEERCLMLATQPKGTAKSNGIRFGRRATFRSAAQSCSSSHDNLGHSNSLHDADSQIPLQIRFIDPLRPATYSPIYIFGKMRVFHQFASTKGHVDVINDGSIRLMVKLGDIRSCSWSSKALNDGMSDGASFLEWNV